MKTIGALILVLSISAIVGCDGGPDMGMPAEDARADVKPADGGKDVKDGDACTIFYKVGGYADPCNAIGEVCQSPEITDSVIRKRPSDPKNIDGKMTGVCSNKCVVLDRGVENTFAIGQACGVSSICKYIYNNGNPMHPSCMGSGS